VTIVSSSRKYDDPPIIEVVCGVHFDPIVGLDPVMVGKYWSEIADRYPGRELRPAVRDEGFVLAPMPPIRALLIAADGATLVQIQQDRFYFNWRRDNFDAPYPRFSDHDGAHGVGSLAIAEFELFTDFCKRTFDAGPAVRATELAKVDLLTQGKHWTDFGDLAQVLPWLNWFYGFSKSPMPSFGLRFEEHRDVGLLTVLLGLGAEALGGQESRATVKLEARLSRTIAADSALSRVFEESNGELNRVFEQLIPENQRDARFVKAKGT
jgi:hypothetical protein